MPDLKSIDSQIASAGNNIVNAIQAHYGKEPINFNLLNNPTALLSAKFPENKVPATKKPCNLDIEFLNSYNDLNLSKEISSLSLDPIIKRLIQEKEDIMRAIEGWIACQASDGARQPILAKKIVEWMKKVTRYMKCGSQLVKQINTLVNGWISAVFALIDELESLVYDDILAANAIMSEIETLDKQLKDEGVTLAMTALIYSCKDYIAFYNELDFMYNDLMEVKSQYSKDHLHAMEVSIMNSLLCLLAMFRRTVNRINRHNKLKVKLTTVKASLETTLLNVNNLDLSVTSNPGGTSVGALTNYSFTNDSGLFTDYDYLTHTSVMHKIDEAGVTQTTSLSLSEWYDIFTCSEEGYITFSGNDFGVFKIGASYEMPKLCPASQISVQLVINGGDWVIQASTKGLTSEDDDPSVNTCATQYGKFVKVPEAPTVGKKVMCHFDELIRAVNRPSELDSLTTLYDPTLGSDISVPDKNSDYVISGTLPTLPAGYTWSTLDEITWASLVGTIFRYLTQDEIDYLEDQYTQILQTLNMAPNLYKDANGLNQALVSTIYSDSNVTVTRAYRMPNDTQLRSNLLNTRPFSGMQIYTKSLNFRISRQAMLISNIPYFAYSGNSYKDAHVIPFGLKADWGFAPSSQM